LAAGWLHWGFGLIGSALLARKMAQTLEIRNIRVDYPLLGTAAYLSMLLWHAGTTASAPLLINTPGHFLEKSIGLIPLSETIFLPMNIAVCAFLFLLVPWIVVGMRPKTARPASLYLVPEKKPGERSESKALRLTFAERLDLNPWIGRTVGAVGILTLASHWMRPEGFSLTHNIVNFILLSIGLLIHGSPLAYAQAIAQSVRGTSGIILQYPFYGGIMGLIEGSGLGKAIAALFIGFSSAHSLPFFAYLAATFTKLFVPSGGGEWAVEGPVMLEAARSLGSSLGKTTMGIAYGNMVGNLFQPFWAIPLLSVLGLRARDIMGFCLVIFLFAFPILGLALLLSR
jgi:short-chain fatty acids transporter